VYDIAWLGRGEHSRRLNASDHFENLEIVKELRCWGHTRDEQVIPGAGAGNVSLIERRHTKSNGNYPLTARSRYVPSGYTYQPNLLS